VTSEKSPRSWPRPKPKGFDDVPELSDDEVERRVELRESPAAAGDPSDPADPADDLFPVESMATDEGGWIPGPEPVAHPEPADEPEPMASPEPAASREPAVDGAVAPTTVVRSAGVTPALDPRRILWRDSATILVFVVLALLGLQAFAPPIVDAPTDTPLPSGVTGGSQQPGFSLPPGVTFGPIIDPSLGIDATPTPIPVITLGPSPSPRPTPRPTPKATQKGTPKPPPTAPPPTAEPTDSPAP
jgi:hypothetical protein